MRKVFLIIGLGLVLLIPVVLAGSVGLSPEQVWVNPAPDAAQNDLGVPGPPPGAMQSRPLAFTHVTVLTLPARTRSPI